MESAVVGTGPEANVIEEGGSPGRSAGRMVQLLVERVDVMEDAPEVRIRAEGLASLVAELRQGDERIARAA